MKPSTPSSTPNVSFRALAEEQMPPFVSMHPEPKVDRAAQDRPMSVGAPSAPVLGLPLVRWIPQDCHSYMDYLNAFATGAAAFTTDDKTAQIAGITLASLGIGLSAVTDYRVSVAKLVPIEAHEVVDYVWGAAAIAAPFALGYWKSSPKVAITHVVAGVGSIVSALLTDYRSYSKRKRTSETPAG